MKALFLILIFISNFSISQTSYSQIGHDSINTKLLNELVIDQINYERFTRGIQKLVKNKTATSAAKLHNDWMIKSNTFEHSNNGIIEIIEIIYCDGTTTYVELSKQIVKAWMDSPDHRVNILDRSFDYLGVAIGVYSKTQESKKYLYPAGSFTYTNYSIKATCAFDWAER